MENELARIKDDELMFELRAPDGHEWKVYLNGRHEGFPEGTIIGNKAIVVVNYLKGLMVKERKNHIRNVYDQKEQPTDMGKEG